MTVPPAKLIKQLILDENLGVDTDAAWRVFIAHLPNDPNNAICVYDTMGRPDGRMMRTGEKIIHHGIQILVRGKDYLEVWERVSDIGLMLDVQVNVPLLFEDEAHVIANISRSGSILYLGIEPKEQSDRKRHEFTINAFVTVTPIDNYSLLMVESEESAGEFRFLTDSDGRLISVLH